MRADVFRVGLAASLLIWMGSATAQTPDGAAKARAHAATRAPATDPATLVRDRVIVIPGVPNGPFTDSLALDLAGQRLFATPQEAKAVAVIDLRDGSVSRMIAGIGSPHGIVYDGGYLLVSDGATDEVKVFEGKDFAPVKSIRVAAGADMASFDPVNHVFYVSSSGGSASGTSTVTAIDTRRLEAAWTVKVDTAGIEGSAIDVQRQLLYVTMRASGAIGVIDLRTRRVVATWKMPAANVLPWAVAVDPDGRRLFVACREAVTETGMHGAVVVLNADTGAVLGQMATGGWMDGIHFDAKRQQIHATSGLGRVESFAVGAKQ